MTWAAMENSAAQGQPVLLFDFLLGGTHYRYTTADRSITYLTNSYAPAPISRSNIVNGPELRQATLQVKAPRDFPVALLYQQAPPAADVMLTIFSLHYSDPDGQGVIEWTGRVLSVSWQESEAVLSCEPIVTGILTTGLRRRWQRLCPHVLYGTSCTASAPAFAVPATIDTAASGGTVLTSSTFTSAPSLAGGYLEWDTGNGYLERRSIDAHSGNQITLAYGHAQLVAGLAVRFTRDAIVRSRRAMARSVIF